MSTFTLTDKKGFNHANLIRYLKKAQGTWTDIINDYSDKATISFDAKDDLTMNFAQIVKFMMLSFKSFEALQDDGSLFNQMKQILPSEVNELISGQLETLKTENQDLNTQVNQLIMGKTKLEQMSKTLEKLVKESQDKSSLGQDEKNDLVKKITILESKVLSDEMEKKKFKTILSRYENDNANMKIVIRSIEDQNQDLRNKIDILESKSFRSESIGPTQDPDETLEALKKIILSLEQDILTYKLQIELSKKNHKCNILELTSRLESNEEEFAKKLLRIETELIVVKSECENVKDKLNKTQTQLEQQISKNSQLEIESGLRIDGSEGKTSEEVLSMLMLQLKELQSQIKTDTNTTKTSLQTSFVPVLDNLNDERIQAEGEMSVTSKQILDFDLNLRIEVLQNQIQVLEKKVIMLEEQNSQLRKIVSGEL